MNADDDEGEEFELERAAYKVVDLLLPEKEPLTLTPEGTRGLLIASAISCVFFGVLAFILGARDWWLMFWLVFGAAFTAGAFLNAAYRPFHDLDRAWRHLCLRYSTQIGWLILGLLAYIVWS